MSAERVERARGPHRREEQRPLPADWKPSTIAIAWIHDRGYDAARVVALYHEAHAGRLLKRWTDASFRRWVEAAERSGALRDLKRR